MNWSTARDIGNVSGKSDSTRARGVHLPVVLQRGLVVEALREVEVDIVDSTIYISNNISTNISINIIDVTNNIIYAI